MLVSLKQQHFIIIMWSFMLWILTFLPRHGVAFLRVVTISPFSTHPTMNPTMNRRRTNPNKATTLPEIPSQFQSIMAKINETATIPKEQNHLKNAHDPFRFEWGAWVNMDTLEELMIAINDVRASCGSFEVLLDGSASVSASSNNASTNTNSQSYSKVTIWKEPQWEMNLYALSSNAYHQTSHPTGSWTILKALTGVIEIAMMKKDRNGNYNKTTKKDLRGGIEGKLYSMYYQYAIWSIQISSITNGYP
jgi:hypothetical protein